MGLELKSKSFKDQQFLDKKFTCEGENISPHLEWINVPHATESFALIMDDPDAPRTKPWVHWIIFNIPSTLVSLAQDASKALVQGKYPDLVEAIQGINDFGKIGYGGPCPPKGNPHRYHFKLFALDTKLSLHQGATKEELLSAIEGHILDTTELVGLFGIS